MKQQNYIFAMLLFLATASISAQSGQTFTDKSGAQIKLDINEMVFVEDAYSNRRIRHFQSDPQNLLGVPDGEKAKDWPNRRMMSLGCRGSVTAVFNSVGFYDGPGADLLIFEAGSVLEPTSIAVSTDGKKWIRLGKIEGGNTAVDIKHPETKGKLFHFVLLRDLGSHCVHSKTDGADVDAIAAINYKKVEQEQAIVTPIRKEKTKKNVAEQASDLELDLNLSTTNVDFTVFPNPTSEELNIKFELEKENNVSIRIFNNSGKVIKNLISNESRSAGEQIVNYALGSLAAGTYYVQLTVGEKSVVKKLMKT